MKTICKRILAISFFLFLSCNLFASPLPSSGKGMWIWKIWNTEGGNLNTIVTKLKSNGVKWVIIKLGDSDSYYNRAGKILYNWASAYNGFDNVITQFHNNGIKVFGWQFVYSYNKWNTGTSESAVANRILDIKGIDGLIIDAEVAYEGQSKSAVASHYLQTIRANHFSAFIGFSSFARVTGHQLFPWLEFGLYCDVNMPQTYWAARCITPATEIYRMETDFKHWETTWQNEGYGSSIKPKIPVGQGGYFGSGCHVVSGEISTFSDMIQNKGYQGVSLYSYRIMNQNAWSEYGASWVNTGISLEKNNDYKKLSLSQNYPNPFSSGTKIKYNIPKASFVSIKIYDMLGREVATLVNGQKPAGSYSVTFHAPGLTNGIYFYRLSAMDGTHNFVEEKKLILRR